MMNAGVPRVDAMASVTQIIEAARHVFSVGDGSGTLRKIAHEAGVGIATLYRHFPNREALAIAVYDQVFEKEIQPILDEFERTDAPRHGLLQLGERLLLVLDRERGLTTSLGNIARATHALMERNMDIIENFVTRAKSVGNLREDLSAADVPALMGMIAAGFGSVPAGEHRHRYLSLLLDALNPAQAQSLPEVSDG